MSDARLTKTITYLLGNCTCHEGYKSRNLTDPQCMRCELESDITDLLERHKDEIEKLRWIIKDAMYRMDHGEYSKAREYLLYALKEESDE